MPKLVPPVMWFAALASGVIYVLYALVLQRGYKAGDFAVVYSIARGTVPMLSVLAAIAFWGAMPSAMGWLGVAAVVDGVLCRQVLSACCAATQRASAIRARFGAS